jgi:hypothetical protein
MTLARVRRWRKKLIDSGVSAITVAKAYRLLRAVFNTALDDEMIKRNPCRIKGADREGSPASLTITGTQRARRQNRPVNPSGGSVSDLRK